MARVARAATDVLLQLLRAADGLAAAVEDLARSETLELPVIEGSRIVRGAGLAELAEKGQSSRYPAVYVYCDRVANTQREKFRSFSGKARMNIEVRASGERVELLEWQLQCYADAITDLLERRRGDWGAGIGYGGGYDIEFSPVKQGGRNYTQAARIVFEVDVSQPAAEG